MVMHFIEKKHSPEELKYCVLFEFEARDYPSIDISNELLRGETFFIHSLQTLNPLGFNIESDLSPFI